MTHAVRESVAVVIVIRHPDECSGFVEALKAGPALRDDDEVLFVACRELSTGHRRSLEPVGKILDVEPSCGALCGRNRARAAVRADLLFFPSSPELLPLWAVLAERHASWIERFVPVGCIGAQEVRAEEVDRRFAGLVVEDVAPLATMWRRTTLEVIGGFDIEFDAYDNSSWYGEIECQRRAGRWGYLVVGTGIPGLAVSAPDLCLPAAARLAAKQLGWLALPWLMSGASDLAGQVPLRAWRTVFASTRRVMKTRSAWRHMSALPPRGRK